MGALLLVTLLDLTSASEPRCTLTGRAPHLHLVGVQPDGGVAPFLINVDEAAATAIIRGTRGAPVEVVFTYPIQFRGTMSSVPVQMNPDGILDLRGGATLLHPYVAGGQVVTDIDLGRGARAVGVKLPCAALTLDRLSRRPPPGPGPRWHARSSPLVVTGGDVSLTIEMAHPESVELVELERRGDRVRVTSGSGFTGWVPRSQLTRWRGPKFFWMSGGSCVVLSSGDELSLSAPVPLFAEPAKGRWGTLAAGSYLVHRSGRFASLDHLEIEVDGRRVSVFDEPACRSEPMRHAWIPVAK